MATSLNKQNQPLNCKDKFHQRLPAELFTNYINPFIYYSQAHTVGVDIKQDKYPNLKGICLVDKHTTYKEVAQGIFRLRKLNLGHTVILYSKDDGITSEKNT